MDSKTILTHGQRTNLMARQSDQTLFGHERPKTWRPVASSLEEGSHMEALRALAGGIAHNFNNLNMGIQGNTTLMLFDIDPDDPNYQRIKTIEALVHRGSILINQLLGYAGEAKCRTRPIALNRLVKDSLNSFAKTAKGIQVRLDLAEDLLKIEADQKQIAQVLLNLYTNAADAMPRGGDLSIKTKNLTHKDMVNKAYKPKPGNYVALMVADNGTGMDKETMARVFEPFFSTKPMDQGMGLGLASVYGIVKAQGGYIDVDSEVGRGTTFKIYLPASKKALRSKTVTPPAFHFTGEHDPSGGRPMIPRLSCRTARKGNAAG